MNTHLKSVEMLEMTEQRRTLSWVVSGYAIVNENFTSCLIKNYRCYCFQSKHVQEIFAELSMSHLITRQKREVPYSMLLSPASLYLLTWSTLPRDESATYVSIRELQKSPLESNELKLTQDDLTTMALLSPSFSLQANRNNYIF